MSAQAVQAAVPRSLPLYEEGDVARLRDVEDPHGQVVGPLEGKVEQVFWVDGHGWQVEVRYRGAGGEMRGRVHHEGMFVLVRRSRRRVLRVLDEVAQNLTREIEMSRRGAAAGDLAFALKLAALRAKVEAVKDVRAAIVLDVDREQNLKGRSG